MWCHLVYRGGAVTDDKAPDEGGNILAGHAGMSEQVLMKQIMIAVSEHGGRVWRNNSGAYKDAKGHFIRYGVASPGGSDLIGYTRRGQFLAIEVKYGRTAVTSEQRRFVESVRAAGGVGVIAYTIEDVLEALERKHD